MFKIEKSKKALYIIYTMAIIIVSIVSTSIVMNRIFNKTEFQAFRDDNGKEEYEKLEKITIERNEEYVYHFKDGTQSRAVKTSSEVHYAEREQ